jgi:hypothetical protein
MPAATVKIPQVLNAGLAAGVFICVAQRLGTVLTSNDTVEELAVLAGCLSILLVGSWNLKNFIDEYKAFEQSNNSSFRLAPTVIFGSLAYTALGVAGSTAFAGVTSMYVLAAFFLICGIWSAVSFFKRRGDRDERTARRSTWMVIYPICAIFLLGGAAFGTILSVLVGCLAPLVMILLDSTDSKTFSTHDHGAA